MCGGADDSRLTTLLLLLLYRCAEEMVGFLLADDLDELLIETH